MKYLYDDDQYEDNVEAYFGFLSKKAIDIDNTDDDGGGVGENTMITVKYFGSFWLLSCAIVL